MARYRAGPIAEGRGRVRSGVARSVRRGGRGYRGLGELRDKLASHADELIAKVVELAKGGDVAALRLVL